MQVKKLVEGAGKTALYGGALAGAGPAGPAALAGIAAGGRLIDAVTGKRSNVANYIKQNRDNAGVRETQSPSVRKALTAQQERNNKRKEKQEQLDRSDYENNRPITNLSAPVGQVYNDTGLDRKQQVAVAERMAQMPEHQDIKEQLEQLIKSVKGINQQVDNIRNVIPRIVEEIRKD